MYVEDLFLRIGQRLILNPIPSVLFDGLLNTPWYQSFIPSVAAHIAAEKPLSTNQSQAILKLIAKIRHPIVRYGMATDDDIDRMLRYPQHRRPLYQSSYVPREVRHLGDNLLGFRFKQDDEIVQRIKRFGQPEMAEWARNFVRLDLLPRPRFDWDHRIWIVPVLHHNILGIIALINEYRFRFDEAAKTYLRLARQSIDQGSAVALLGSHEIILANVCDNPLLAGWLVEVGGGLTV